VTGVATTAAPTAGNSAPAKREQHPPRPRPRSWPETCQDRDALTERLSSPLFPPASAEVRRSVRRGLTLLLDWLEQQPGSTWQDRWLASGAEAAGPAWADLVTGGRPPLAAKHVRNDLLTAMRLMLTGQVLRPGYGWLLRYRPSVLLEEARSRIDPAGFARLRAHFDATGRRNPQDLKEALNRVAWILLSKGGLIRDITIGDCVELGDALQEHQCQGANKPASVLRAAGRDRRAARRRTADPAGRQDDRPAHPRRARRQVRPAGRVHAETVHLLLGRAGRRT